MQHARSVIQAQLKIGGEVGALAYVGHQGRVMNENGTATRSAHMACARGLWATIASAMLVVGAVTMGPVSATPTRSEGELIEDERARLENAHRRLREAVHAYDQFIGRPLKAGGPPPAHDFDKVARTQAEVEAAERELWQVREEVLHWPRPAWAPGATLIADWFSAEDAVYDEAPDTGGQSRR